MLNKLSKEIYEGNKLRGFDVKNENIGQTLMLIVSEVSEALESDRKGRKADFKRFEFEESPHHVHGDKLGFKLAFETTIKDTFEDEIADTIIRCLDLCGGLGIDIEKHIDLKLKYNSTREFKHGKKY